MARKLKSFVANPYPVHHPQWKHWGLGLLVAQGKLTVEQVVSWNDPSPAHTAFQQGFWAWERHEIALNAYKEEAAAEAERREHPKLVDYRTTKKEK